ncbi:MAG: hypothetical protein Q7S26_04325 [bacterium]|nr:hypothetical protein [bacterium]
MRNAQTELLPLPPLSGLVEKFRHAVAAPDMGKARENIVAHPECDAEFIATLLTGKELHPPHGPRNSSRTWNNENLFLIMFEDPELTFAQALAVWEHPNFRGYIGSQYPPTGGLCQLFRRLEREEQFAAIENWIAAHGVEHSDWIGKNFLKDMFRWLPLPADGTAEHIREMVVWALCLGYQDPQRDRGKFLDMLRLMKKYVTC